MASIAVSSDRHLPPLVLAGLVLLALLCAALFMTLGAKGSWSFVLPFRGTKLAALVIIGHAIALSTVLFQTVTGNRILTPSIMGLDALYVLLQTWLAFVFGAVSVVTLDSRLMFAIEVAVMVGFAGLLQRWLVSGALRSLHLMVLVGLVGGILFRSLSNFMGRLLDPNEFVVLQDRFFASFNSFDASLLPVTGAVVAALTIAAWRMRDALDVLALGRDAAIGLGIDYRRMVLLVLGMATVLVAVSTALVGPVTFLGLLVANLAYLVIPSHRHALVLPAASLIAVVCLVGGQTVLERVFAFDTSLSIIVEFLGGIVFLVLLLSGRAR